MWVILTISVFFLTRWIAIKTKSPLANPLLLSILIIIPILLILKVPYQTYYAQNKWMTYLLQPAVVALAYPLYQQIHHIRSNWKLILIACTVGSIASMLSTGIIAAFFHADPSLIASLMGKSVTTPIGMAVSSSLGGSPAVAAILVLTVGGFGSIFAYPIYQMLNIQHPIARGLTMGTVSHALGTATCLEKNHQDAAFSSLALAICGIITSIIAPILYAFSVWLSHILPI